VQFLGIQDEPLCINPVLHSNEHSVLFVTLIVPLATLAQQILPLVVKPVLQVKEHFDPEQVLLALATLHFFPQSPQLLISLVGFTQVLVQSFG